MTRSLPQHYNIVRNVAAFYLVRGTIKGGGPAEIHRDLHFTFQMPHLFFISTVIKGHLLNVARFNEICNGLGC